MPLGRCKYGHRRTEAASAHKALCRPAPAEIGVSLIANCAAMVRLGRPSFGGRLLPALPAWRHCPSCANGSRFPIALREHSHVGTQGIRFCLVPRGPFVVIISARRIADDGSTRIVVGAHNRSMYRRHKFGERRACVRAMRWQCCCTKYVGERRACVRPTWLGNAMAQYVQRPCRAKAVQRFAALRQLAAVVVARWCCLVA